MKGLGSNFPGFFAEYATVPEGLVFSVEGIDPDTAVFTEPAACAMHGLETLEFVRAPRRSSSVRGRPGLLLAQLIRSGGAASVTVAAPDASSSSTRPRRWASTRRFSSTATTWRPTGPCFSRPPERTDTTTSSRRPDPPSIGNICVPLTRNGGTVLVYGVTRADETVSFHPFDVFRREITIKGSFAEMTSFGAAIRALRSGRARTDGIITHRFSLDDYGKALDAVGRRTARAHKVVIVP